MLLCGLQTFKSYINDLIGDEDEEEKKEEENVSTGQLTEYQCSGCHSILHADV